VPVGDDAVAVGTGGGTVQVVSARDGRPRWRASLDGEVMALAADASWVVAGTNRGDLACLAAADGAVAGRHVFPSAAATSRGRELQAVFAIELTGRALIRLGRTIVPASLPELRFWPAVDTGHPPVRDGLLAATADALAEAAMPRPGGFDPATREFGPHGCVIRARELASLAVRFEHACPQGAPAPVELAPGRWLAILSGADERTHRVAVLDATTGASLSEAPLAAAPRTFALAAHAGVAYVAAGVRLIALAP
jgi:hypothetical protein